MFVRQACIFVLCLEALTGLAQARVRQESQARPFLGTVVRMDICYRAGEEDALAKAMGMAWQRVQEVHDRCSLFDAASDVSLINRAQGKPVRVHEDVFRLFQASQRFFDITGAVLDVTVAPLTALWQDAEQDGRLPSEEEIRHAQALVGMKGLLLLAGDMVQVGGADVRVDLNSVAAGFAADEVAGVLKGQGFHDFLVDAGGEAYASGYNCDGRPWRLGIRDPENKENVLGVVPLSNAGISTSGDYEHFFEINGERWSHVIDPLAGYPVKRMASATVISPTALEADALSTALCILPPQEGMTLVRSLGSGREALVLVRGVDGVLEREATPRFLQMMIQQRSNGEYQ